MIKIRIAAACLIFLTPQSVAAQQSEKPIVLDFVKAVERSSNLAELYPEVIDSSQKSDFVRMAECKPSNFAKRGDDLFTVDWSCEKISDSGFMQFRFSNGQLVSVKFFPISSMRVG